MKGKIQNDKYKQVLVFTKSSVLGAQFCVESEKCNAETVTPNDSVTQRVHWVLTMFVVYG